MKSILKITVLIVVIFSSTASFAQTQTETEKWILEKLRDHQGAYSPNARDYSNSTDVQLFSCEIINGNFEFYVIRNGDYYKNGRGTFSLINIIVNKHHFPV